MILTVTLNPSIDTSYALDKLCIDDVNRVAAHKTAGGKGLNVTRVLHELGARVLATGFVGGYMGSYLQQLMDNSDLPHDFLQIEGETRVCISVLHEGKQTEFLEAGPCVTPQDTQAFKEKFTHLIQDASCVTISGSMPQGIPDDFYAHLITSAAAARKHVLLDTSGAALEAALLSSDKPTLIKPNLSELNAMLHTNFTSENPQALVHALECDERFTGVAWIVISMGKDGLLAYHQGSVYRVHAAQISCVNATGSGDSTIAGFAYALSQNMSAPDVLRYGAACGTLNALEAQTGHIDMDKWDNVYKDTKVERIK